MNSSLCYGLMLSSDWWSVVIVFTAFMNYGLFNVGAIHVGWLSYAPGVIFGGLFTRLLTQIYRPIRVKLSRGLHLQHPRICHSWHCISFRGQRGGLQGILCHIILHSSPHLTSGQRPFCVLLYFSRSCEFILATATLQFHKRSASLYEKSTHSLRWRTL